MANAALFIGWNRAVGGKETQALELFNHANQFWSQMQAQGKIESFEQIILTPHAGDLNGFTFVRGERNKLNAVKDSAEFMDILLRAHVLLDGVGCVDAHIGEGTQNMMQRYQKAISK